jgi:hypothetical protein
MEEYVAALEQAFITYRQEIEACQKKSKPTDGLLGFGHSLKDDACHERFDERIAQTVSSLCQEGPDAETAEQAVILLIARNDSASWPLAAQWMLRAVERHSIPLISFLAPDAAARLQKEYAARYRPWDRLPAQKEVLKALKGAG